MPTKKKPDHFLEKTFGKANRPTLEAARQAAIERLNAGSDDPKDFKTLTYLNKKL